MNKQRMPVLFIGHGAPTNALENNEYTKKWKEITKKYPKPKAILCISAHWIHNLAVTAMDSPATIHDFYGFGEELSNFSYHAPGSPDLARKIKEIVKVKKVILDDKWGLDHGSWSVLAQMYPKAEIPVVQLSIDQNLPKEKLIEIGKELSVLRDEGVLIIGAGNIVHNLRVFGISSTAYPWAEEFDLFIQKSIKDKNYDNLINYDKHPSAKLAQPTDEHYLPLLYVVGAAYGEDAQVFNNSIFAGSISMTCVCMGLSSYYF